MVVRSFFSSISPPTVPPRGIFLNPALLADASHPVFSGPMRLTKFEHAGLLLEQDGQKLFVDPGSFTSPLTDTANAVAVVITHEHPDHWTPEQLNRVLDLSPEAKIYAPEGVAKAAADFDI